MSMVFEDRQATYPNRYLITPLDGNPFYALVERADEPIIVGTPLNAEVLNGMLAEIIASFPTESEEHPGCYYRLVGQEKEWINPPMIASVEYRTSERRDGKPVYVKKLDITLPDQRGSGTFEIVSSVGWPNILDISGSFTDVDSLYYYPLSYADSDGRPYISTRVTFSQATNNLKIARLKIDVLNVNFHDGYGTFYIKYTK